MTTSTSASAQHVASNSTSNAAAAATVSATNGGEMQSRAMQSDEDFNIRFVNLVRMHKCLYDKKVPEYRNRDNQEKAWSLISQETKESVIHCKERWRNLRACLSRYIKQQTSSDPQHKPYYLTEHMAFLLPFLKSSRSSFDSHNNSNGLAALSLFQISQQHLQHPIAGGPLHLLPQTHLQFNEQLEMKQSISGNEDEETIDAFDPAVTANLQIQHSFQSSRRRSPALSDTASANSMQNFIPDVQLAEVAEAPNKRIKTECHSSEATTTAQLHMYSNENSDMEFFRSILPDIAALTPQQKRKFKIGILELIDDVVDRYPAERERNGPVSGKYRRSSAREWRK